VIGLDVTYTASNALPDDLIVLARLQQALLQSAEHVRQEAQANIERELNTTGQAKGVLRDSIEVVVDKSALRAEVGSRLVYSRIHELGGTIRAVNAPFLVFRTADGQWHSVKQANIPARPYLRPALDSSQGFIEQAIESALL
jgi:phage gpG-like protein